MAAEYTAIDADDSLHPQDIRIRENAIGCLN